MDLTSSPGHLNHQFVAEDAATLRPATEMTPNDMNGPMNELVNIILAAQIAPNANNHAQVLAALQALFLKRDGDSGVIRTITPAGGARVRELGDIANAATVGGIEIGISYNCNIDLVTGIWAGRDVNDICWLEKWSDTGGQKEYWFAPTAAAGAVPVWSKAFTLDIAAGKIVFSDGTKQSTLPKFNIQILTTSGNFTTPANITVDTVFKITILGAGGGGAGTIGVTCGGGGGAGGAASFLISGLAPSTSYAVVIGASGTPGAAGGANNGSTGGTTQITINGVVYSCSGGLGGVAMSGSGIVKTATQGTVSASITALPSAIKIYQFAQRDSYYTASSSYQVSNGGYIPFGQGGDQYEAVPADGYGCGGCGGVAGLAGLAGRQGWLMAEWVA